MEYKYGLTRRQYAYRAFVGLVVVNVVFIVAGIVSTYVLHGLRAWLAVAFVLFAVYIGHGAMMNAYHDWQHAKRGKT